jgi:DNA-binding PucR family transcriptional regulator
MAALRWQLSNLQAVLALSMRMTQTGDERQILHLATTSVPSLSRCRLCGVYLLDEGWHAGAGPCTRADVCADLEAQFAVLSSAGGAVAIPGEAWGWAFSLRSLEADFGFLMVGADEEPHDSEKFLLRVLAQQTGIAMANARIRARKRATADELRTANRALAESAEELRTANRALSESVVALQRSTAIHDRLTRVAIAAEGREGIARAVHELTGYPVAVEDRHGNLRAWAGPDRPDPYPKDPPARRERMVQRALQERRPIRDGDRLLAVATPRKDVLGVLVLIDPAATSGEAEHVALEHGTTVLSLELARLRSVAETDLRLRRDLVEELLSGADEVSALARAEAFGYDIERPHRVVVIEGGDTTQEDDAFFDAVRRASRDAGAGSLLVARAGAVVLLSDSDQPWGQLRTAVLSRLAGGRCRIGVGGTCDGLAAFPRSYSEARLALKIQGTSERDDRVTVFDQLGIYQILADVKETARIERFVRKWLGALIDYDTDRGFEPVTTVTRYLECGGSYDATATALGIHRSTLKYRLQRIRDISGHDLSDPDTQFNLQFASRAWHTLLALRDDGASPTAPPGPLTTT